MSGANNNKIKKLVERAYKFEKNVGGCPQAVLAAFKEEFDFISDDLFRAGTGLAGGLGMTGNTCGALLGASLVVSTVRGRDYNNLEDKERVRYEALEMVKELCQRFENEYGSTHCYDIQTALMGRSFNLWDKEDKKAFIAAGGHDDKCPSVCGKAARWVAQILSERGHI